VALTLLTHRNVGVEGVATEDIAAMNALTLLRPLSPAQPLPADLRPAIGRLPPHVRAGISIEASERALINKALLHIGKVDPDVLAGHNICGFDIDVLLTRCDKHGASMWSRIGRLRRIQMPRAVLGAGGRASYAGSSPAAGRLLCDTYLSARELLRETTYTLSSLTASQLGERRAEVDPLEVPTYLSGVPAERVLSLLQHTEHDARLALRLMFALQVLPLTKQLTNLAGNLWSRSLRGARAERIEYLLLHEFHRLKYVLPDKERPSWATAAASGSGGKGGAAEAEEDDPAEQLAMLMGDGEGEEGEGADAGAVVSKSATGASRKAAGGAKKGGSGGAAGASGTIARGSKKRAKAAYAGGLVLEPKKGLYDKYVLLLDFNSLYPSIIQEYNICFTTVERPLIGDPAPESSGSGGGKGGKSASMAIEDADGAEGAEAGEGGEEEGAGGGGSGGIVAAAGVALPDLTKHTQLGVLPRVIQSLVHRRRQVKAVLARETDAGRRQALDIRQKALKILANSMYGCLGFSNSRFYARPIAALVTSQGRDILQRTVALAESTISCEVIYGDTDSIMIATGKTDVKEVKALGAAVKREVRCVRCWPALWNAECGLIGRQTVWSMRERDTEQAARPGWPASPLHLPPLPLVSPTYAAVRTSCYPPLFACFHPRPHNTHPAPPCLCPRSVPRLACPRAGQQAVPLPGDRDRRHLRLHAAAQEEKVRGTGRLRGPGRRGEHDPRDEGPGHGAPRLVRAEQGARHVRPRRDPVRQGAR